MLIDRKIYKGKDSKIIEAVKKKAISIEAAKFVKKKLIAEFMAVVLNAI